MNAQLLLVPHVPAVHLTEQLTTYSTSDRLAFLPGRGGTGGALVPGDFLLQAPGQLRVCTGVAAVLLAQSHVRLRATFGQDAVGIGAESLPEKGRHLRLSHLTRDPQQGLRVGDPLPGRHPFDGVVVAQLTVPGAQLVGRGYLAGVVGIPVPSAELVEGHHRLDNRICNLIYQ